MDRTPIAWIKIQLALIPIKTVGFFKPSNLDVLPTWILPDPGEAVHIAETIGYPVAVKLRSQISRINLTFKA